MFSIYSYGRRVSVYYVDILCNPEYGKKFEYYPVSKRFHHDAVFTKARLILALPYFSTKQGNDIVYILCI